MKPPSYRTPITDRAKRPMDRFADEWVPRYICEELERQRNELLEALEDVMERLVDSNETDEAAVKARAVISKAKNNC